MARTVLITGASGFVGRHLLAAIGSTADIKPVPTSRRSGIDIDGMEAVHLGFDNPNRVRSILERIIPDIIVHLAAEAVTNRTAIDPMAVWHSNFWHTIQFAEIVRVHLPRTIFIFVSSAAVYGLTSPGGEPIGEDALLRPANPYGVTKAAADLAIGEMALRGLRAIRLRPFNHTGPGQSANFVVPALARQVARIEAGLQEPTIRSEALESARDFLDVRDVCAAYAEVIRRSDELPPGVVLNVASGQPRRISEILRTLLEIAGVPARIESQPHPRPNEARSLRGDASKARKLLEWAPRIPFEQTLHDTLDWWRQQLA